tara:strand:- start:5598 stop:6488 length:891 start_codon:yes stop_codon:yes gene_type:complete
MDRAIIFGFSDQDGTYLHEHLANYETISYRSHRHEGGIDIRNRWQVNNIINKYKPRYIFNLAGIPSTDPQHFSDIYSTIYEGTFNILESVRENELKAKSIVASSAYCFKAEDTKKEIKCSSSYRLDNPYSLARINTMNLAKYYSNIGVQSITAHLFHHESQYRSKSSLIMQLAKDVIEYRNGKLDYISLRNEGIIKEWNHASDLMRALVLIAEKYDGNEIIIASGKVYSAKAIIEIMMDLLNLDPPLIKSQETTKQVYMGDAYQLNELGWKPNINIRELCSEILFSLDPDLRMHDS